MATKSSLKILVTGIILWIISLPFLLAVFVPLIFLRLAHHFLAKIFRPDLIPIVSFEDAIFTIQPLCKGLNNNAAQIWRLKGKLNTNKFRDHFYKVFLSTPELRERHCNFYCTFVVWGLYIFKKPLKEKDFSLKHHIKEYDGPELEDELELDSFLGRHVNINMEHNLPNWEILIIYLKKLDETVLLFRVDHGLSDGYTFSYLVSRLSGLEAEYLVKNHNLSFAQMVLIILSAPKYIVDYSLLMMNSELMPLPNYPEVKELAPEEQWLMASTTLDLGAIKRIRRATNTHFNTVLGEIQFGSLKRYCMEQLMEQYKNATEEELNFNKFPERYWLPSPAPWPNHSAMRKGQMCNQLTLSCFQFPGRETCPLKRLLKAEAEYLITERIGYPLMIHWVLGPLALWTPPSHVVAAAFKLHHYLKVVRVSQTCLSPMMLSSEKYSLMGHQVDHIYFPLQARASFPNVSLYLLAVSNSGKLDVIVTASKRIFKDQSTLNQFTKKYLKDELELLEERALR